MSVCACGSDQVTAVRTESGVHGVVCSDCGSFHHQHRTSAGDGRCAECRTTVYTLPAEAA